MTCHTSSTSGLINQSIDYLLSPDGMLGLQAEQEALSEGLDIVDTMRVILRHVHRKVAYIKQF